MAQIHPSVREVAVLQQATQMLLSSLDPDTVLHHTLLVIRNYFGAERTAVYLVDDNELFGRAQDGYDENISLRRLPIGKDSIPGWVAFTRAPLYLPDMDQEYRYRVDNSNIKSVLALPLLVRDRVIGVLEISSDRPESFTSDAIGLLSVFAGQAAIALENARLYSTDLRRIRQIEIMNLIARSAAAASDQQQFFSMAADLISDTFEAVRVAVVLRTAGGHLSLTASAGVRDLDPQRLFESARHGLLAEAFSERSLVVVNDISTRPNWISCLPDSSSELCAPLISLGEILGAIILAHSRANFFTQNDRAIAQATADVCATAARNVQLAEELRRVANLDPLTGIYNQHYFHTAVSLEIPRAQRHKKEFGLLMLDLHDFRRVNSVLGLNAGDNLMRRVATVLKATLRSNDVMCRYLGDRFALLLPEISAEGLSRVEKKLQQSLETIEIPFPQNPSPLTASWARVQFPQDASTELELMKLLLDRIEKLKQPSSGTNA